jgi:hypothetical protein
MTSRSARLLIDNPSTSASICTSSLYGLQEPLGEQLGIELKEVVERRVQDERLRVILLRPDRPAVRL